jgi:hypothetical protein
MDEKIEAGQPRLVQDTNWQEVPPFTEIAARSFIQGSGLTVKEEILFDVLREAAEMEQTRGLIRPITMPRSLDSRLPEGNNNAAVGSRGCTSSHSTFDYELHYEASTERREIIPGNGDRFVAGARMLESTWAK